MAYSIVFRKSARKQIGQLPEIAVSKISTAIDALADEPRPANCKKMQGVEGTYRIRVGDYRIIYTVNDTVVTVEIVKIGSRQDVYKP